MAKFFKGLAASGAWSCFDEFNRIFVEVLSVIAQQILQIQGAKGIGKEKILFEGTELKFKQSCNIFITMNPGYAGRTELPDNLKALFRPVAMMVPDYAMISEIKLYSYGFIEARSLARKIVATYKLCSELLSSQSHYDYGMRAVKAVLTTSSQLKRKFQFEKEEILVLRALNDVNLPKFLNPDIFLFNSIINDLFPGLKPQNPEYGTLNMAITNVFNNNQLQNLAYLRKKIIQLYEMINCRHGLMLVGQTLSGKTTCYKTLTSALKECILLGDKEERQANYYIINPKSVTLSQLYGYSDPISKEWTEGVLGEIFRKCATSYSTDRQFIIFDGPVDADWIENMNSVLDDNKKLCLMNGETIRMSNHMTMMFEVSDLNQASPATVSRCVMIYMQPEQLGWWPIFSSKLSEISSNLDGQLIKHIEDLFDGLIQKTLDFIKSKCIEYQTLPEIAGVQGVINLFLSQLTEHGFLSKEIYTKLRIEDICSRIDMFFIFSIIWGLAGNLDTQSRMVFNKFFRKMIGEAIKCERTKDSFVKFEKISIPPEMGGVILYDFYISEFKWKNWKDQYEKIEIDLPANYKGYHEIIVPTIDFARISYIYDYAISNKFPLLLIGPTGTGKTLYLNNLLKSMDKEKYMHLPIVFSSKTTAGKTQEILEAKLEKRRKNVYGPRFGMNFIVFIDELNMPKLDRYGAQSSSELLRQFFDHKGFYSKDRKLIEIIDTQVIAAMSPPGGGRSLLPPRLLRHFFNISCVDPDEKSLKRIYGSLMNWHMTSQKIENFDVQNLLQSSVDAAIELYFKVSSTLKAIPSKPHYMFNPRDLTRVMSGIQSMNKKEIDNDVSKIVRLCVHEFTRVFFDRMTCLEDEESFFTILTNVLRSKLRDDLKMSMKGVFPPNLPYETPAILSYLRFSDILSEGISAGERVYNEIVNSSKLETTLESFMEDYNLSSKTPMSLVIFQYAADHIIRLLRILRMRGGHGMLIGLGGSGRMSLTKLATFIREYEFFEVFNFLIITFH